MNNKIIGYDEAVSRLKEFERRVRNCKSAYKIYTRNRSFKDAGDVSKYMNKYKKEINYLLSIIASEKRARRMWGLLKNYQNDLYETAMKNVNAFGVHSIIKDSKDD